jgi:hypothetical protein
MYEQACASCHGRDGRGAPEGSGITVPLPDFTDCIVSTAETTANWAALVRHGGPFLGMSDQMPAFGDALSDAEVTTVLAYVRGFCGDPRYPLGDLNFARPVFAEKAFPEDEVVLVFEHEAGRHEREFTAELVLEKRIGPRGQVEVTVPASVVDPDGAGRNAGIGDVEIAYKHALLAVPTWRSLLSAGVELALPTGNRRHGVGAGTLVVAPQLLSGHAVGPLVVQAQARAELPADTERSDRQMLYRIALQWPIGPYRRSVVPGLELEQSQALDSAVHAATLLAPTFYLPISRRGHVAVAVGVQIPVAGTEPFNWRLGSFLLWDYADGPLWAW